MINLSSISCLRYILNCWASGLSLCTPLPRMMENKFSMQFWFRRLVSKYLMSSPSTMLLTKMRRAFIDCIHPRMHGNVSAAFRCSESPYSKRVNQTTLSYRNVMCEEDRLVGFPKSAFENIPFELKTLKRLSNLDMKSDVARCVCGKNLS